MVRRATLKRLFAAGGLLLAGLNVGCVGLDTRPAKWFDSSPAQVGAMDVLWFKDVKRLPDPTRHGALSDALAARVYLYPSAARGKPVLGDGKVTVELFDDSDAANPRLLETTNFPAEVLTNMASSDMIGLGYTLVVPCQPNYKVVHMTVKYLPKSGQPLVQSCGTMVVDYGTAPHSGLQTASTR
ncbi:MAG: hypothetical protein ACJ8F7_04590 [Gemmataceae bacterium]